ncbi:MAG: hypothetical protein KIT69_21120, partial [Propionibacteriaceae bacterium]|nr:hypothetical protein [Propionibacteriaceae bacterium]
AIETGRSVLNVSTTGTSQAFAPDGTLLDELAADISGARITTIPRRTGLTPAVALGPWVTSLLAVASLLALLLLRLAATRRTCFVATNASANRTTTDQLTDSHSATRRPL